MTIDLAPAITAPFDGLPTGALDDLGRVTRGKVRDMIDLGDRLVLVATDRISAFDHVLGTVPFRGQVLNQLAAWWFEQISDIVPSHVDAVIDPNVTIGRKCATVPVEVVVRAQLTGTTSTALWTRYAAGERNIYGINFPDGMSKNDPLPTPIITPTTKAEHGAHDAPITEADIVADGVVEAELWHRIRTAALAIFDRGREIAAERGLILVDTKYEFGIDSEGTLTIIDEVHTPDSSRYWMASSARDLIAAGNEPQNLDKEVVRLAYAANGYTGRGDPPPLSEALAAKASGVYTQAYEMLTSTKFSPAEYPAAPRVERAIRNVI